MSNMKPIVSQLAEEKINGYYRIVCPHCGREMKSGEVVYKIDSSELKFDSTEAMQGYDFASIQGRSQTYQSATVVEEEDDESIDHECVESEDFPEDFTPAMKRGVMGGTNSFQNQQPTHNHELFMSGDEIISVKKKSIHTKIAPILLNDEKNGVTNLCMGFKVEDFPIHNRYYTGEFNIRRCCHCKKKLSKYSGQMPTKSIGLIGPSSSGKTVMFTILTRILRETMILPEGTLSCSSDYSHLEKATHRDVFEMLLREMERNRTLPSTNTEVMTEPVCKIVKYTRNGSNNFTNRCLLVIRDVRGEIFTNHDQTQQIVKQKVLELCKSSDGILYAVDSTLLSGFVRCVSDAADLSLAQDTLDEMSALVQELNDQQMFDSRVVVMLMKSDEILRNYKSLGLSSVNFPAINLQYNMVVPNKNSERMDGTSSWYLRLHNLSDSTKGFLKYLNP